MKHIIVKSDSTARVAILIKSAALNKKDLHEYYVTPLVNMGVSEDDLIAFSLEYNDKNNAPVGFIKDYLKNLLPILNSMGVTTLLVNDTAYFKTLTKSRKAEPHYGYALDCAIEGFEHLKVVLGLNHKVLLFDPVKQEVLDLSLKTLASSLTGLDFKLGANIIHSAEYPTVDELPALFNKLHEYPALTMDIETYSLAFNEAGVGTVAFAWDQHNGAAFMCDHNNYTGPHRRKLLKLFLLNYRGKLIFHNANFDVKILIYVLFMDEDPLNHAGCIQGINTLYPMIEDTKLIAYLATNSCAGNDLKLKNLAHSFTGNFAQEDIEDINKIPVKELLEYNLTDCLATWFVYNKFYPKMVEDNQEEIYRTIMLPSVKVLLQMELTGLPMDTDKVIEVKKKLTKVQEDAYLALNNNKEIIQFVDLIRMEEHLKKNLLLKKKVKPLSDFDYIVFNPNSHKQVSKLIYEVMDYPVIDRTKSKAPAVGASTIKKLINISKSASHTEIFENLVRLAEVEILINNFISTFIDKAIYKSDNTNYLHGSFNIGGTVSGRLSSSNPNMQNLPSSGNPYAKLVKSCFKAPPGWLLVGADFASLEDRISALTTKDENKLKVYTDGYDGHCLRAYSYFKDLMPDIVDTVESINSIEEKYPELRQLSKAPTFLLTYDGTYHGLINNVGLPEEQAKQIEDSYHTLYTVSDKWVEDQINKACSDGFVTVAFGLRVRTPLLKQTILGSKVTPYEAKAESRTAGNALGQSYGLLNNRAGIEFQERTLNSPYALDILPVAHIHDAQYFLVRDDIKPLKWLNDNLVECMQWQELDAIKHDEVKLGGNVEVFWPDWSKPHTLPNNATEQQIIDICTKAANEKTNS